MTALVLVVDDVAANVKLLEAKLSGEYYDVITAYSGAEAIAQAKEHKPDLVLLDIMMPGMDGFETCQRLKADPEVSHIPVVMVTALSEKSDRVRGLEAGADDFLTKPINDAALFARVKSLVRIKVIIDTLRLHGETGNQMGIKDDPSRNLTADVSGARIAVIDDDAVQCSHITQFLSKHYRVTEITDPEEVQKDIDFTQHDLVILSTQLMHVDGLRLASHLKSQEELRHIPILMLVDEDDATVMLKGLDMGINDYLSIPVDYNEMSARIKTQIRRKRYQEALRANYQTSVSLAITDGLTGLYNRHYLNTHLENMVRQCLHTGKPFSLLMMDMDHFKSVNDTHGHDVGDRVLKALADIIINSTRSTDLVARFGGEEFVILMPETDEKSVLEAAERIREHVQNAEFVINENNESIQRTISIGISHLNFMGDTAEALRKRADTALYAAKEQGRNCIVTE